MTKAELLRALEPFDDEIEVCIAAYWDMTMSTQPRFIRGSAYGLMKDGEGILLLSPGEFKSGQWRFGLNGEANHE